MAIVSTLIGSPVASAQKASVTLPFPPTLPGGKAVLTHTGDEFLKPPATLRDGVTVAKTAPTVDFLYFPGQDYPGNPWSNWGDSLAVNGKYYASIGDHLAIGRNGAGPNNTGTGRVFEYDPEKKTFRQLLDTTKLLNLPTGHYTPGKIHSRLDVGSDGWLYCATHRGSTTVTADTNHYEGDWVLRCNPKTGESEVVVRGPVPKHCIPCSVTDGQRMIFYGGTAAGTNAKAQGVQFFAYDLKAKKLLYTGPNGPARYMILAESTGRVYWTPGKEDGIGKLVRYDPEKEGGPVPLDTEIGLRAATEETKDGKVFTVSKGTKGGEATLFAFDTKTEKAEELGPAAVGVNTYITSLDVDPTGRYVYYIPGAHGGSEKDHSAVVQYDTMTKARKVIAFLHPFIHEKTGATLVGTFSSAVDPSGDKLYVTWNVNRGGKVWDCCALTVIHIPAGER